VGRVIYGPVVSIVGLKKKQGTSFVDSFARAGRKLSKGPIAWALLQLGTIYLGLDLLIAVAYCLLASHANPLPSTLFP
jgi:hypothetical protein